jgi:hypothetical protein
MPEPEAEKAAKAKHEITEEAEKPEAESVAEEVTFQNFQELSKIAKKNNNFVMMCTCMYVYCLLLNPKFYGLFIFLFTRTKKPYSPYCVLNRTKKKLCLV